jgi:peroxiredoxin
MKILGLTWLAAVLLCAGVSAQTSRPKPVLSEAEQAIATQLKGLRKVPDDQRGQVTRDLALAIRALPAGSANRLMLAEGLAGRATEGDPGHGTLVEVAATLAGALREKAAAGASAKDLEDPLSTLAQLSKYEEVPVQLEIPGYAEAVRELDRVDRQRAAAEFSLKDLTGKQWSLKSLRGKVVMVNFWATWCPPCRKEMPDLEVLHRGLGKQGLVVLALSDEDEAKVRPFIAENGYSFPVLLDQGGAASKAFAVQGIPKTFLFDRKGRLVAQANDMRTKGQFEQMLKKAGL